MEWPLDASAELSPLTLDSDGATGARADSVSQKREKERFFGRPSVRLSLDVRTMIHTEYIVLAAIAAILILVLILLLCMLCCHRQAQTHEETEIGTKVEYVPDRIMNASVYVTPGQREEKEKEATATVLMDAGYTGTQLLEHGVAREATKTELLETGFTKSQLRDAKILPKEKKRKKPVAKEQLSGFKSKPLKAFDTSVIEDDEPVRRTKTKKRPADPEEEEAEVTVRKKKSPANKYDFDEPVDAVQPPLRQAEDRGRRKSRTAISDSKERIPIREKADNRSRRVAISESKDRIPVREKKRSEGEHGLNLTTFF